MGKILGVQWRDGKCVDNVLERKLKRTKNLKFGV
jgi:hypothetical protein